MDPPPSNDWSDAIVCFNTALGSMFATNRHAFDYARTHMIKARDLGHPGAIFYLQHQRSTITEFFFAIRDIEDESGWSLYFQAYYIMIREVDTDEALRLFTLSAERHKNGQAAWTIGWESRDGEPAQSYKYLLMAADFGYAAVAHYGLWYHYETNVRDLQKAFVHLLESAKLGYCHSYRSLVRFYDNGLGGAPKDHSKADYYATIPWVTDLDPLGCRRGRMEYLYENFLEKQHRIYPFVTNVCKTSLLWNTHDMIFMRKQVGEWTRQARERVFIWLMIYKRLSYVYFPRDVALHIAQLIWEERKKRK